MSHFNIQQQHPLIPRKQTYVLNRKILSIHSYDRDINKWPQANHFEIELPQSYCNVQSMRLVQIMIPNNQYVFTHNYQNTKFLYTDSSGHKHEHEVVTVNEGTYTPFQLAEEITQGIKRNPPGHLPHQFDASGLKVMYNETSNKFWFFNDKPFHLIFDNKSLYKYPDISCGFPIVYDNYIKWGLGYYLGFEQKKYHSKKADVSVSHQTLPKGLYIYHTNAGNDWFVTFSYETWNQNNFNNFPQTGPVPPPLYPHGTFYYIEAPCTIDIFGEDTIYMEVEAYNSMDEIQPYSQNTIGTHNNDYNGKINSAFAKIPTGLACQFGLWGDGRNYFVTNVSEYSPPIDRIKKLKFTFRYHDGRPVDFKCSQFNFSLEINMLQEEQERHMNIRVPALYNI